LNTVLRQYREAHRLVSVTVNPELEVWCWLVLATIVALKKGENGANATAVYFLKCPAGGACANRFELWCTWPVTCISQGNFIDPATPCP